MFRARGGSAGAGYCQRYESDVAVIERDLQHNIRLPSGKPTRHIRRSGVHLCLPPGLVTVTPTGRKYKQRTALPGTQAAQYRSASVAPRVLLL